jgi:hypothetical protein
LHALRHKGHALLRVEHGGILLLLLQRHGLALRHSPVSPVPPAAAALHLPVTLVLHLPIRA